MLLDLVKTALCLWTIALLPKPSNVEVGSRGKVTFRRLLYFTIEKVIVIVRIIIDLLERLVYIGIAGHVLLIVTNVKNAAWVRSVRAFGIIVNR
jgi:hypothetical protein